MVTRDDLIEAMALAMASRQKASKEWLEKHPHAMDEYKRDASACCRVAAEFVAEWLDAYEAGNALSRAPISDAWRKEMT